MKRTILNFIVANILVYCLQLPFNATAQSRMIIADKFSSDSLSGLVINSSYELHWIGGGSRYFWYTPEYVAIIDKSETNSTNSACKNIHKKYVIADTRTGKKTFMFDNEVMLSQINAILKTHGKKTDKLNIWQFDFPEKNVNIVEFEVRGIHFRYDIRRKTLKEIPAKEEKRHEFRRDWYKSWSCDSTYYFQAIDNDLYLYKKCSETSADSIRLTNDGCQWYSFSNAGNSTHPTEGESSARGKWLCNSHKFMIIREDKRNVAELAIVNSLHSPRPSLETYKFPMPGEKGIIRYELYVGDAEKGVLNKIDIDKYQDQQLLLPRFLACPMSDDSAWLLRLNRTRDSLDLCRLDAENMRLETLICEPCAPHLNEQLFEYHIINCGSEILWWSERSGRGQWFLYDGDGRLKRTLTPADMVAGRIARIDTTARRIIFEGYGKNPEVNPSYRYYYSASLDGNSEVTLLTPGDGYHDITFSPDGKLFKDTWSRMDKAPENTIRDIHGKEVMDIEDADVSLLHERGWKEPVVTEFLAADSLTRLYGVVYLPFNIEKGRKYPIISNVYPGPQTDLVPLQFTIDDNYNQSLAQLGFVVINVSYRGSNPYRGRDFYNFGYGNLRDYALDDDYAVIRQTAERYDFADSSKVGIYGHSGGGFMAATAMLTRPEFYKVCVAASGNYDNNIYTQWWGESFHGVTRVIGKDGKTEFSCKIPTTAELAGNLNGRLLLITGDIDNNVHPASTFRLAKALMNENKRFDMMVIPGADHGLGDKYYINLIRYYFTEHLLGLPQNDIDIVNHK